MAKRLVVSDGSREREMMIVGRLVVGRDPACDITYDDALLSRKHAEFVASGDEVIVRDLGSRNGVFVNGAKIAERTLRSGDIVQVGPVRARYVADAAPVGIAPEQVDAEYTAVISAPVAAVPPRAPAPVVAAAIALPTSEMARPAPAPPPTGDDDDRTRMIQAPRAAKAVEPAPPAAALPETAAAEDDDRTHFLKSPVARPPATPAPSTSGTGAQARPTSASSIAPPATPRPAAPQPAAGPQDDADHGDGATMIFPRASAAQRVAPASGIAAPVPVASAPPAPKPQSVAAPPPPPAVTPRPAASRPSPLPPTASMSPTPNPQSANPQSANPQLANPQLANPQSAIRNPQSDALSSYVAARVVVLVAIVLAAAAVPLMVWRSAPDQASLMWLAVPVAAAAIAAFTISAQINQRVARALDAAERNRS